MGQIAEQRGEEEQAGREERGEQAVPQDQMHRILSGEQPELASMRIDQSIPAGTVRVSVIDENGQPVAGQVVSLGIMAQGDQRSSQELLTDEAGHVEYTGLAIGTSQAYRVNVVYRGAKTSSSPFQLPPHAGYDIRVVRLPTTRSDESILQLLHRTFLELQDQRMHVVHQVQLVNLAREIYVFPDEGRLVRLPEGFTAFQFQAVMTDQRVDEDDEGLRIRGSLPPGRVNLVWAYDVPIDGTEVDLSVPVAFPRTFAVRVEAEIPDGVDLDVRGLPSPETHEVDGHRLVITEQQRSPEDPELRAVEISVRGIPGPGPYRWIAVGAALVLAFMGFMFLTQRGGADKAVTASGRTRRKKDLLDRAAEIERMFEENEIGPKYRKREMDAIVQELASVLREDEAQKA
jgi:hypothetical protein